MSRVAIQVLAYHSASRISGLLESLKAQTFSDWELFICDNSCDANEAAGLREALAQVGVPGYLTVSRRNEGFSGGHNFLFSHHRAPLVLFLNDDARLEPTYLERCVRFLEAHATCAAVSGLIYRSHQNETAPDPRDPKTLVDTAGLDYPCLGLVLDVCAGRPQEALGEKRERAFPVFGVSGVASLFRREAIEAASVDHLPFDSTFFMYKEDVDLAIRLRRVGFEAWCEPHAVAYHVRSVKASGESWSSRMRDERKRSRALRIQTYRNQWALYVYHASWHLGFGDGVLTGWHELKRSAALFFLGSPFMFFGAWGKILKDLPRLLHRRRDLIGHGVSERRLRGIVTS